jgi:hypothetical protein
VFLNNSFATRKDNFAKAKKPPPLFFAPHAQYLIRMSGFFFIAMIIAMLATLSVLVLGLAAMVKGGEFNRKYGNKLMRARVLAQGIALAFFALAVLTAGQS